MSRYGRKTRPRDARQRGQERSERAGGRRRGFRGSPRDGVGTGLSWVANKRPVFRFVLMLGGFMLLFNVVFYVWLGEADCFTAYLNLNAEICAAILRWFGESAKAAGMLITSPKFSLEVRRGCDAIQASAFFVFAMLASPLRSSLRSRIAPILIGTLALLVINLGRIISLYYTGVYFRSAFDAMHLDVWQALFIFLPLFFWIMWARRETRRGKPKDHDAT